MKETQAHFCKQMFAADESVPETPGTSGIEEAGHLDAKHGVTTRDTMSRRTYPRTEGRGCSSNEEPAQRGKANSSCIK